MDTDLYDKIHIKMRDIRKAENTTSKELSKILDISPSVYSRIESGDRKVSLETLVKFARHFHLSLDYLVAEDSYNEEIEDKIIEIRSYLSKMETMKKYLEKYFELLSENLYEPGHEVLEMLLARSKEYHNELKKMYEKLCKLLLVEHYDTIFAKVKSDFYE